MAINGKRILRCFNTQLILMVSTAFVRAAWWEVDLYGFRTFRKNRDRILTIYFLVSLYAIPSAD